MKKIVINGGYGGFSLSHKAVMRYAELKGVKVYGYVEARNASGHLNFDKYEPYKEGEGYFCIHYICVWFYIIPQN